MKTRLKEAVTPLGEISHVLLQETIEYTGRFLTAYARLRAAESSQDAEAFASAWGEMMTALSVLQDKVEQSHDFLEAEAEALPDVGGLPQ
jgi:hypothetical protein